LKIGLRRRHRLDLGAISHLPEELGLLFRAIRKSFAHQLSQRLSEIVVTAFA
jgi:hypothetical protein